MKNRNGQMTAMGIIGIILGVIVVIGVIAGAFWLGAGGTLSVAGTTTATPDFDGEFDDSALPDDVGGTELVLNTSYAEASEAFTVAYEVENDLNQTGIRDYVLAFGFDVSGDMEDLDVDGQLVSTINTSQIEIKSAYVVLDDDASSLDSSGAIMLGSVDDDDDKFEINEAVLSDGDYVMVIEIKVLDGDDITDGADLITVEMDADSTDSDAVDEGVVTIRNFI